MTMSEFDAHEAGGAGMKPSGRTHQEPRLQSIINALGDAADRYGEPPDPDPEDQAKLEAVGMIEELKMKLAIAENALFRIASVRHCARCGGSGHEPDVLYVSCFACDGRCIVPVLSHGEATGTAALALKALGEEGVNIQ